MARHFRFLARLRARYIGKLLLAFRHNSVVPADIEIDLAPVFQVGGLNGTFCYECLRLFGHVSYLSTPSSLPILVKASMALSRWRCSWAALNCTCIRAWPLATTGKKKPITYMPSSRELCCKILGQYGIVEHDGYDRVVARFDIKTCLGHLLTKYRYWPPVYPAVRWFRSAYPVRRWSRPRCWGQGIAEQVGPAALAKHFDDLFTAAGKTTAGATEGFAEGTGNDVDSAHHTPVLMGTPACFTQEAAAMAFVDHNDRVVFVGHVADLIQLCDGAIHTETSVGNDDPAAEMGAFLQLCFRSSILLCS